MSYQVISRKWRPGVFDDVVGQEHVVRTLTNAVDSGKVGHAYIFSGPRGVGKTTVARILAKCLNCDKGPTGSPCNECSICKSITQGSSIDTIEIDGASNNSVDNIRELCESVRYAPTQGRHKVYIIDEVHMLSTGAFNALLKTLEEPPAHVIFIFATTEPHKIPATIHSRCQSFDFRRIPVETIHKRLRSIGDSEKINIDDEALYMLIREADGSLRDAQSLLEQVMSFSEGDKITSKDVMDAIGLMDRGLIFELMEAVIDCNGAVILGVVEKAYNFGYDLKRIVLELLEQVRDITVIKTLTGGVSAGGGGVKGSSLALPEAELRRLEGFGEKIDTPRLQMLFDVFSRGYDDVVRSSTPRFSLEMMLLGAVSLDELKSLTDIVTGLKGMKVGGQSLRNTGGGESRAKKSAPVETPAVAPVKAKAIEDRGVEEERPSAKPLSELTERESVESDATPQAEKELTLDGFLGYIKSRKRLIYQSLASASLDMTGDRLSVATDATKEKVLEDIKSDILGLLKEYFKRNIVVEVTLKGDSQSSEVADGAKGDDSSKAGKAGGRKGNGRDPIVEDAMKTLGGKFIEERRRDEY